MKKIFVFSLVCFAGFSASSQHVTLKPSLQGDKPTKTLDKSVDRKFLGNGNELLNLNGSLPKHIIGITPVDNTHLKISPKQEDQLIGNTLLFTGKLSDYVSVPFWITPEIDKKTPDKH